MINYDHIEVLWDQEYYEGILDLLLPDADFGARSEPELHAYMGKRLISDPQHLAFYAKLFLKLVQIHERYLPGLTLFFLSAVHDPEIEKTFADHPSQVEINREALIKTAEDQIRHYESGAPPGSPLNPLREAWNRERRFLNRFKKMAATGGCQPCVLMTPRYAVNFGKAQPILTWFRSHQSLFEDTKEYLDMGAYYSESAVSLFYLPYDHETAVARLPDLTSTDQDNIEFSRFGYERVHFTSGCRNIERGLPLSNHFAPSAASLFQKAPSFLTAFLNTAQDAEDPQDMKLYEEALMALHKVLPISSVKKALSRIIGKRGLAMLQLRQISPHQLVPLLEQARLLDPENQMVKTGLERFKGESVRDTLLKAFRSGDLLKACRIAQSASQSDIKPLFFDFLEQQAERVLSRKTQGYDQVLNDLYRMGNQVDHAHPFIQKLRNRLRATEGNSFIESI